MSDETLPFRRARSFSKQIDSFRFGVELRKKRPVTARETSSDACHLTHTRFEYLVHAGDDFSYGSERKRDGLGSLSFSVSTNESGRAFRHSKKKTLPILFLVVEKIVVL
ncbi:hypothetical protein NPIL_616911 [Nephila pilipes]|uniref:Uncharacterized protein n=1 Tax=Nephila pilipes TaxID=299642 RepID=A0A8X6U009_NEPPI|nr:hypothetical protein NPIL_616911 [Nephila pilipes]